MPPARQNNRRKTVVDSALDANNSVLRELNQIKLSDFTAENLALMLLTVASNQVILMGGADGGYAMGLGQRQRKGVVDLGKWIYHVSVRVSPDGKVFLSIAQNFGNTQVSYRVMPDGSMLNTFNQVVTTTAQGREAMARLEGGAEGKIGRFDFQTFDAAVNKGSVEGFFSFDKGNPIVLNDLSAEDHYGYTAELRKPSRSGRTIRAQVEAALNLALGLWGDLYPENSIPESMEFVDPFTDLGHVAFRSKSGVTRVIDVLPDGMYVLQSGVRDAGLVLAEGGLEHLKGFKGNMQLLKKGKQVYAVGFIQIDDTSENLRSSFSLFHSK